MSDDAIELRELIAAAADQTITDGQRRRLIALLKTDEAARRLYLESMSMDAMLRWDYGAALSGGAATAPPAAARRWPAAVAALMLIAVVVGLAAVIFSGPGVGTAAPSPRAAAGEGGPIAVITAMDNAQLVESEQPAKIGSPLRPGWVKLSAGKVRIDLMGGAGLILEGPAELGLNSVNRVFLRSGTLTAYLDEPGAVLTVTTPTHVVSSWGKHLGVHAGDGSGTIRALAGDLVINPIAADGSVGAATDLRAGKSLTLGSPPAPPRFAPIDDFITPPPPPTVQPIDFSRAALEPYGYQDGQHKLPTMLEVLDGGSTLRLTGNAWKMMAVHHDLTRDTVVELQFRSPRLGEIHGFGFDTDDHYRSGDKPIFQLYGYEVLPHIGQQFNNYDPDAAPAPGGWKTYRIRVGRYLPPGSYRYLYFAADDDVTAQATSEFRNVRIYEAPGR